MKISLDTKEDSHEEIEKVIKMLQNLVGNSQEVFTNESSVSGQNNAEAAGSAFTNIFGDSSADSPNPSTVLITESFQHSQSSQQEQQIGQAEEKETGSGAESTQDLFAELFSEEELKKMDIDKDDEDEKEIKPKNRKYNIELY